MTTRKRYTAEEKANLVLELLKEEQSLSELGSVDVSAQPDENSGEGEKAEIAGGEFVETGEDAAIVFELVDETFDEMAFLIEMRIIVA